MKDFSAGLQIIEKVQKRYYFVRFWIRARIVLKFTYPDNYDSRIPAVSKTSLELQKKEEVFL